MTLTISERNRLETAEALLAQLAQLVEGGGSRNQLNRMLVLAQNSNTDVETRLSALETKVDELIELARKLQ